MKKWQCSVCDYIHTGETPPDECPVCGAPASEFVLLEDEAVNESNQASKVTADPTGQAAPEAGKAAAARRLYDKTTDLMIRHHAHPVMVHLPNGVIPVATVLFIMSWIFDFDASLLVKAGFINLVFVMISLPLVLFSGFQEWKKKYNMSRTKMFKLKILAAGVTTTACMVLIIWYLINPAVLTSPRAWIFILINLVMLGAAGVAGFIGGKLVFND